MIEIILTPIHWAVIIYLTTINLVTFFVYGLDKAKSGVSGARRISEKTLLIIALIGGSLGALAGMKVFRHKTKKLGFQAPLAVILCLQIFLVWFLFFR
ncbi:MAG: DUF1294 domain-containing protein [Candidatus Magasanikbacteria bacterium]|nr:DUF1294 domain-containing protein [Candidatus Magasanikbacteria bacterium]